jgi:hypothetical protein
MGHPIQASLDFTGFIFAIGIAIYGGWISKYLSGGKIQRPFLVLVGSSVAMAVGDLARMIWNVGWEPEEFDQLHSVMDIVFLGLVLLAMFLLYRTWRSLGSASRVQV